MGSKAKKIGIGVGIVFAAFIALGVIGYSLGSDTSQGGDSNNLASLTSQIESQETASESSTDPQPAPTLTTSPSRDIVAGIEDFTVQGDGSENGSYTVTFSLFDKNKQEISSNGSVTFTILDAIGEQLYSERFTVSSSDFDTWYYTFTGVEFLAYGWTIPTSEVQKGIGPYGSAKLVFKDHTGTEFTATETLLSIPKLSEDEVTRKFDEEFMQSATTVNQKIQNGNFEVTLVRYGIFTHPEWMTGGDKISEFRVDLIIKNTGNQDAYMPSTFVIIDSQGIQHDSSYGGTLNYGELLAGATTQGYVVFDGITADGQASKLVLKKIDYPQDQVWTFDLS